MKSDFNCYRIVRGDGNCYHRAFGYSYLEHLIRVTTPISEFNNIIEKFTLAKGYFSVRKGSEKHQELRNIFLNLLQNLKQQKERGDVMINKYLFEEMHRNKDDQDEALVWEMRTLTANYLEVHKEHYINFCQEPFEKILKEVLSMGKEADGIGIGPLQMILNIKTEIIMIDRNLQSSLSFETVKLSGKLPLIQLLFKPGHYDILYNKDVSYVDGYDENTEDYTGQKIPQNYNLEDPSPPYYKIYQLAEGEEDSPKDEDYDLVQKVEYKYRKTTTNAILITQPEALMRCQECKFDFKKSDCFQLGCGHNFDVQCLNKTIQKMTNNRYIQVDGDNWSVAKCNACQNYVLKEEEIESLIGVQKYENLVQAGKRRAINYIKNLQLSQEQQALLNQKSQALNGNSQNESSTNKCYFKCWAISDLPVVLQCGHQFCKSSIIKSIYEQTNGKFIMEEGQNSKCPIQECFKAITNEEMKCFLNKDFYQKKFEEFSRRSASQN